MMRNRWWLTLALVWGLAACNGGGGGTVCCEVAGGSCASGQGVTTEYCEDELGGTVAAGDCNVDTGICE